MLLTGLKKDLCLQIKTTELKTPPSQMVDFIATTSLDENIELDSLFAEYDAVCKL